MYQTGLRPPEAIFLLYHGPRPLGVITVLRPLTDTGDTGVSGRAIVDPLFSSPLPTTPCTVPLMDPGQGTQL